MLRTPVGLALGGVVVLGVGAIAVIVWHVVGQAIDHACSGWER